MAREASPIRLWKARGRIRPPAPGRRGRRPWRRGFRHRRRRAAFTWIVASRTTSERQACEASATSSAAPAVRQARKVMIAMTTTSARPATESPGMSGALVSNAGSGATARMGSTMGSFMTAPSVEDRQFAVADDQPAGEAELIHELEIMGRDDHRGAEPVEFDEQPEQPARQARIDIAGRLVGEQQFRANDERARDRRALLFAAGKDGRRGVHPVAEADPAQKLDHFRPVAGFLASHRALSGSATFS